MAMTKRQFIFSGLVGLGAGIAGILTAERSFTPKKAQTDSLWPLALQTPTGLPVELKTFQGKPLLINFWATWCSPCIEEMPLLNQFYLKHSEHGANSFQLLGIAADKAESVAKFLKITSVQFPIALAGFDGIALSRNLGNLAGGLPYSILIGGKGDILFAKEGQLTTNDLSTIDKLLSVSSG